MRRSIVLGDAIGDLEEVEVDDGQFAWGKDLKVRVSMNVTNPLKRGKVISIAGGRKFWLCFVMSGCQIFAMSVVS